MENQVLDDGLVPTNAKLIPASKGKRFANFLIDYLGAFVFLTLIMSFLYLAGIWDIEEESTANDLKERLFGMFFYAVYYTLIESALGGKSLGKFVTRTKTVTIYGQKPDFVTFLKRSFSRIVPFEPFSFLGSSESGWHDRWSDTMVIDEKLSVLPNDVTLNLVE